MNNEVALNEDDLKENNIFLKSSNGNSIDKIEMFYIENKHIIFMCKANTEKSALFISKCSNEEMYDNILKVFENKYKIILRSDLLE